MGMAASQVRLLQLTSRNNDIGWQLENLSMQKTSLSRDMQRITKEYQSALSSKVLKWSTNSGITNVDLSYKNLMSPGKANNNKPYLISDSAGRIVLDDKYKAYAEMISPNGLGGAEWGGETRAQILSELTGISEEKLSSATANSEAVTTSSEKVNKLREEMDVLKTKCTDKKGLKNFLACFDNITGVNYENKSIPCSVTSGYYDGGTNNTNMWRLDPNEQNAEAKIKDILNQMKANIMNELSEEDYAAFEKACTQTETEMCNLIGSSTSEEAGELRTVSKENKNGGGDFAVNVCFFIDSLLRNYRAAGGSAEMSDASGEYGYCTVNRESEDYKAYMAKKAEYEAAFEAHKGVLDTDNQSLTAEEETKIAFYDQLFTAIAENGWTSDYDVNDTDYLNQMLQNNQYYITTMTSETDDKGNSYYEYDQSIASNHDNIFSVSDSGLQYEAMAEYEYEKGIINEKETRIDTRMQNLQTEQAAIKEMIKGIEQVKGDNSETNFGIFA